MIPLHQIATVIIAATLATTTSVTATVSARVQLIAHGIPSPSSGLVIARSVSDSSDVRELPVHDGSATGSLPRGEWFVSTNIERTWSEPVLLRLDEGDSSVDLPVYALARLKAKLHVDGKPGPADVHAYFQRLRSSAVAGPEDGHATCTRNDQQIVCDLPAGLYDIGFRIPGHITVYRWNVHLDPHADIDAGEMTFVPGSMLTGRVDAGRSRIDAAKIDVILTPVVTPAANEELRRRSETARQIVHPNARGFFAFVAAPGRFLVHAVSGQLASDERDVTITRGQESILRSPLVLASRATLTIHVDPPHDPWSRPWNLTLSRRDPQGVVLSHRMLRATIDGSCTLRDVAPGSYSIEVMRPPAGSWATHTIEVNSDATIAIQVPLVMASGSVRSGDDPLPAALTFRSFRSMAVIPVKTKADGTFVAWLPAVTDDTWDEIEIVAESPHVQRKLTHVQSKRRDDGTEFFELTLKSSAIGGRVLDENGNLAGPALVDIVSPDGGTEQIESLDGVFKSSGFEAGTYHLSATTRDQQTAQPVDVIVKDDDNGSSDVDLVVSSSKHLGVVVVSTAGPVLGASVFITAAGDESRPLILQPVDPDGHFDVRLPPGTVDVVIAVSAPGFVFRMLRLTPRGSEVTLAVEQRGGTLTIDVPPNDGSLVPHLLHDGALLPAVAAGYLANARFNANPAARISFDIPAIEAGAYSICWLSPATARSAAVAGVSTSQCQSGYLSVNGELSLVTADRHPVSSP